jgi:hypothetical protein
MQTPEAVTQKASNNRRIFRNAPFEIPRNSQGGRRRGVPLLPLEYLVPHQFSEQIEFIPLRARSHGQQTGRFGEHKAEIWRQPKELLPRTGRAPHLAARCQRAQMTRHSGTNFNICACDVGGMSTAKQAV